LAGKSVLAGRLSVLFSRLSKFSCSLKFERNVIPAGQVKDPETLIPQVHMGLRMGKTRGVRMMHGAPKGKALCTHPKIVSSWVRKGRER
jgi:hypothetical protein